MKLESFDDVRAAMQKNKKRPFHLLLGNGFSMSYDPEIFSYNALHEFVQAIDGEVLPQILEIVKTNNFELVMQQLENFAAFVDVFGIDQEVKQAIESAGTELKQRLVEAIGELHPEHVFKVAEEESEACAQFLKGFLESGGSIFTTNYDLLLYWVLMRNQFLTSVDGFGRDAENPEAFLSEDEIGWSELRWGKHKEEQPFYYVHGALPLFDTGIHIVKEVYDSRNYLLENIRERIDRGDYPIFVTAGNGHEKLARIRHNRYLDHSYESLASAEGSLVSFGFNFGEYDEHIVEAINRAAHYGQKSPNRLWSVYIGVYSEQDQEHIEGLENRIKCKVHIFDSKTANVWGKA